VLVTDLAHNPAAALLMVGLLGGALIIGLVFARVSSLADLPPLSVGDELQTPSVSPTGVPVEYSTSVGWDGIPAEAGNTDDGRPDDPGASGPS
jgi:hypothetical protein